VDAGNQFIANNELSFFHTIEDAEKKVGHDILLLSCVLPYLENPYQFLQQVLSFRFKYIIIDNTYFNSMPNDRLTVQKVPPAIYTASYPAWFLNYSKLLSILTGNYSIVREYTNDSYLYLDNKKINYRGVLLKLKAGDR